MNRDRKFIAIITCLIMAFVFSFSTFAAFAETTSPVTPGTDSTPATTTTTKKPATTTTTKKATTKSTTSSSNSGKLTITAKRGGDGTEAGKVKVIYTVTNEGSVTARNIKITDKDIAGSQTIGTIDTLEAGAKKEIEYMATMTKDSTAQPKITCTINGVSRTFTGSSVKIPLKSSSSFLSATLTTTSNEFQPNSPVKFSLVIKNDDTNRMTDLSVEDYSGKTIKSGINLEPGSTTNVDFDLTLVGDTNVYVTIKGKDSSGGDISARSNEISMKANANAVPVTEGISLLVTSDKTELEKKGDVKITLEVKNLMSRPFTNVNIIDKNTGTTLQTISMLSGNDTKTYVSPLTLEETTSFLYEVTAIYEDGTAITVQSNSLEIKVGGNGLFDGTTGIVLISIVGVVVLLIIITSITLLVLSRKEKKKQKAMGAAQSEKYKKSTPKKKSGDEGSFSSFTIADEGPAMAEGTATEIPMAQPIAPAAPVQEAPAPQPVAPVQPMQYEQPIQPAPQPVAPVQPAPQPVMNNSAFEHYGENANLGFDDLEGGQGFDNNIGFINNAGFNGAQMNNQAGGEFNAFGDMASPAPAAPVQPAQTVTPSAPVSHQPMNYNDLDPD
ncbi:MAG: hypothetical protein IJR47_02330 [Clostridia bacterium]|nr:hypothetical protein [Clostridia bacterium]